MKTSKYVLYPKLNSKLVLEYSAFKFGDPILIEKYGKLMAKKIAALMKNSKRDYALYAAQKYPVSPVQKKNSVLMAEVVAKELDKVLIYGEFKYKFDHKNFYDNRVQRISIHKPYIKNKGALKKHNYIVITIDDSIFTGLSFRTGFEQLSQITDFTISYTVVDLKGTKFIEKDVNELYFKIRGVLGLVRLINRRHYVATSQMLRTFDNLEKKDKTNLLNKLRPENKKLFKQAYLNYFGKVLK